MRRRRLPRHRALRLGVRSAAVGARVGARGDGRQCVCCFWASVVCAGSAGPLQQHRRCLLVCAGRSARCWFGGAAGRERVGFGLGGEPEAVSARHAGCGFGGDAVGRRAMQDAGPACKWLRAFRGREHACASARAVCRLGGDTAVWQRGASGRPVGELDGAQRLCTAQAAADGAWAVFAISVRGWSHRGARHGHVAGRPDRGGCACERS